MITTINEYKKLISEKYTEEWYHGTPDIRTMRNGINGVHIGTRLAATQALEARIGVKADGTPWDGTQKYGETLLAGKNTLDRLEKERGYYLTTGYNCGRDVPEEDYYPKDRATKADFSNGQLIPMDALPSVFKVKINGSMSNSQLRPHNDIMANSLMKRSLNKGNARNGFYYINDGEDAGSISAVVPNFDFLTINENFKLIPGLRLPDESVEYKDYRNINFNDIELIEEGDDGYTIMFIGVKLPGEDKPNPGVILDIQLINDELYHPHRHIAKVLQGQGIGYKMTLKFIHDFGHIYTSKGRTLNDLEVPKMAEKLKNESDIEHYKTKTNGDLFILKTNPDKKYLIEKYV